MEIARESGRRVGMGDGAARAGRAVALGCVVVPALMLVSGCGHRQHATGAPASGQVVQESRQEAPRDETRAPTPRMLDEALALMTGSFSSQAQAAADPEFFDIRLEMVQIWKERADVPPGLWIYVEQAQAAAIDRPYRQRVYHVTVVGEATIASAVYEIGVPPPAEAAAVGGAAAGSGVLAPAQPTNAAAGWAGAWREPARFDAISPKDLEARQGCEVILSRLSADRYEGGTQGNACLSSLRGASYATSSAIITPAGLETWDRGYDASGKQVWGAVKGGYRFDRVK